jgi:predicted kinase
MRGRSTFRKGDIRKAVEAVAKATGTPVARVEIDADGKVVVIVSNPADGTDNSKNEWDAKYGKSS